MSQLDAFELEEWTESLDAVLRHNGPQATGELIKQLSEHAESARVPLPSAITTPFRNTISPEDERIPSDQGADATLHKQIPRQGALIFWGNRIAKGRGDGAWQRHSR